MSLRLFEIFSGTPEGGSLWIESVAGADKATQRMNELAGVRPGAYFVFDICCHKVMAKTNTAPENPPLDRKMPFIKFTFEKDKKAN